MSNVWYSHLETLYSHGGQFNMNTLPVNKLDLLLDSTLLKQRE